MVQVSMQNKPPASTTSEPPQPHPLSRKPTKNIGPQSWLLILCTCCTLGLLLGSIGAILYSLAVDNSDLSSWETATCELERMEYMTTETSWDPLLLMDTQRTGIPTSWGLGIYAIVRVSTKLTGRKFTSGGNDCGIFTYSDGCECRNSTCYGSRLGDIRWDECPSDPWCDVTKVVKGPCVNNSTEGGFKVRFSCLLFVLSLLVVVAGCRCWLGGVFWKKIKRRKKTFNPLLVLGSALVVYLVCLLFFLFTLLTVRGPSTSIRRTCHRCEQQSTNFDRLLESPSRSWCTF